MSALRTAEKVTIRHSETLSYVQGNKPDCHNLTRFPETWGRNVCYLVHASILEKLDGSDTFAYCASQEGHASSCLKMYAARSSLGGYGDDPVLHISSTSQLNTSCAYRLTKLLARILEDERRSKSEPSIKLPVSWYCRYSLIDCCLFLVRKPHFAQSLLCECVS